MNTVGGPVVYNCNVRSQGESPKQFLGICILLLPWPCPNCLSGKGQTEGSPRRVDHQKTLDEPCEKRLGKTTKRTLAKGVDLDEGKKKVYEAAPPDRDALTLPHPFLHSKELTNRKPTQA